METILLILAATTSIAVSVVLIVDIVELVRYRKALNRYVEQLKKENENESEF